jgi:hypothetical protein
MQLSAMPFTRLFSTLLITAFCNAALSQDLPSSCGNCLALNQDNVYDLGRPSVVWCSSDPPRPSPVGSSSGTCLPTTSLIQPPFKYPNGSIQCVDTIHPPPCPATAPFASFASCECSNSCFALTKEKPAYLLRSCASCVALGYYWITEDDLSSLSCIRYDDDKEDAACREAQDKKGKQNSKDCIQSAKYRGFPYCTPQAAADKRYGRPSMYISVYTSPSQCANGQSFCASIRVGRAGCIAMIVCLSNILITTIIMFWSRKFAILERSPHSDSSQETRSGWPFDVSVVACIVYRDCHGKSESHICNLFCEIFATYLFAPVLLTIAFLYLAASLLYRICAAVAQGFRTLCCCTAVRSASAANLCGVPQITAAPAPPADNRTQHVFPEDIGDLLADAGL